MAPACLVFAPNFCNRKAAAWLAVAITASVIALCPIGLPIRTGLKENDFSRRLEATAPLSARLANYGATPERTIFSTRNSAGQNIRRLNPGWLRCVLAVIGCSAGLWWRTERTQWILFILLVGITAFLLSFGPHVKAGQWNLWQLLRDTVPGTAQVRSVYRFAWFVQLAITFLAVEGVYRLHAFFQTRSFANKLTRQASWAAFVFIPGIILSLIHI